MHKDILPYLLATIGLTLLISCSSASGATEGESTINDSSQVQEMLKVEVLPTPDYIRELWPEPGSTLFLRDFEAMLRYDAKKPGICIDFGGILILLEEGDFLSVEELFKRFRLNIDDQHYDEPDYVLMRDTMGFDGPLDPDTNTPIYRIPEGYPYFLCFYADLKEGLHTATFSAKRTSGSELSYSWSFYLLDVISTPIP
jgi:hypothetical protein